MFSCRRCSWPIDRIVFSRGPKRVVNAICCSSVSRWLGKTSTEYSWNASWIRRNITLYTDLCERARQDAYALMLRHATEAGANAVVAMRYDANEVAPGVTEVLAYGTAVVLEAAPRA